METNNEHVNQLILQRCLAVNQKTSTKLPLFGLVHYQNAAAAAV